jgi:hypothetical protein
MKDKIINQYVDNSKSKARNYPHTIHNAFVDFTPFDKIIHMFTAITTITPNYKYIQLPQEVCYEI